MVCCSAPNCCNSSELGYRLFRFPSDNSRRAIWLQNCRRTSWEPRSTSRLCEVHFEDNQWEQNRSDGWKKLKPYAIPTLFPVPDGSRYKSRRKKCLQSQNNISESSAAEHQLQNEEGCSWNSETFGPSAIPSVDFTNDMLEPVFIKCEPEWVSNTEESSNFEPSLQKLKDEPACLFPDPKIEEGNDEFTTEEHLIQDVKQEVESEGYADSEAVLNSVTSESLPQIADQLTTQTWWEERNPVQKDTGEYGCIPWKEALQHANFERQMGESRFTCASCGKTFSDRSNLRRHHRVHTAERPYLCTICGRSFNQSAHLKIHSFVHSKAKPHACSKCNKSFSRASSLRIHQTVHTVNRPYPCPKCNKSFKRLTNLKIHHVAHMT